MAAGGTPSLEKYLAFARYTFGVTTALGLAFCAVGQELADCGQWSPTESGLEGLFDAAGGALALAGGVVRIMSDVRWERLWHFGVFQDYSFGSFQLFDGFGCHVT